MANNSNRRLLAGLLILIALLVLLKATEQPPPEPSETEKIAKKEMDDSIEARINAKLHVGQRLKSPSSAKWPNQLDVAVAKVKGKKNHWLVNGYVDSQNSFGAMMRMEYWAVMAKKDNGAWVLIKLQTQP